MMSDSNIPIDAIYSICNIYNILVKKDIICEYKQFIKSKIDMFSLGVVPKYLHQPQFFEEFNDCGYVVDYMSFIRHYTTVSMDIFFFL
jgi:hypothetical protein